MLFFLQVLVLGVLASCSPNRGSAPPRAAQTPPGLAAPGQGSAGLDTVRVREGLATIGYRLERVLAREREDYAVVGGPDTGERSLLLVRIHADGVALLHSPRRIDNFTPQLASWFALPKSSGSGFAYTLDYPSEGFVRTEILVPSDGEYRIVFSDAMGTCEPAALDDVDQNGELELITYVEDPSNGNCISECHIDLHERFGLSIAWVELRVWNGEDWEASKSPNPAYYSRLADQYTRASEWAQTSPNWTCGPRGAEFLRTWASRARALGTGGD